MHTFNLLRYKLPYCLQALQGPASIELYLFEFHLVWSNFKFCFYLQIMFHIITDRPIANVVALLNIDSNVNNCQFLSLHICDDFEELFLIASYSNLLVLFQKWSPVSYNVTDYLISRSIGFKATESSKISEEYGTRHILSAGDVLSTVIWYPVQSYACEEQK